MLDGVDSCLQRCRHSYFALRMRGDDDPSLVGFIAYGCHFLFGELRTSRLPQGCLLYTSPSPRD